MKQLQNNYTTPEQSKRLLELGVPADSADIALLSTPDSPYDPYFIGGDMTMRQALREGRGLPSWSVGRLIEIVVLTTFEKDVYNLRIEGIRRSIEQNRMLEDLIEDIETLIKDNKMDFSKLED